MQHRFRIFIVGLYMVCIWTTVGLAQNPESFPIEPQHYGNVPYLTGGVGLDEREALSQLGRDYSLKLSFAVTGGNYLGNVAVEIRTAGGAVALEALSEGPWFYAKLPPGRYTVIVKVMGKTQQKSVQLSNKGQTVVNFFW